MSALKISLNNSILMQRVKHSDRKAFRELYNALWKPLYARTYTILRDRQLSEDILQEVWIDLWQRRKQIENTNIEAYLFRAVRFKAYNQCRNEASKRQIVKNLLAASTDNYINEIEESLYFSETRKTLLKSLELLPPRCRKVFELSRFEGLKNNEISQHLGISKSTVENHIHNAIKVIKTEISPLR